MSERWHQPLEDISHHCLTRYRTQIARFCMDAPASHAPAATAAAALADGRAAPWSWNRAFWAGCDVRPSPATAAGDVDIHNAPALVVDDYAPLFAPAAAGGPPLAAYVGTVALPSFVADVLPRVARPFVLVTGMSDPGPAKVLGGADAARALAAHPRLVAWHAEMRDFGCAAAPAPCDGSCAVCAKVTALPLGVDLHTLAYKPADRPQWGAAQVVPAQSAAFAAAAAAATHADPRVYVHFGWFTKERRAVLKLLRGHPAFAFEADRHVPREQLWARMGRHAWVLCLQGGGLDCHRTWEALGLGCGVVCEDLPFLRELLAPHTGGNGAVAAMTAPAGSAGGGPTTGSKRTRDEGDDGAAAAPSGAAGTTDSVTVGDVTVAFPPTLPVAAVFAPSGAAMTSPDLALRARAKAAWREELSLERLQAAFAAAADARRQWAAARGARVGGGSEGDETSADSGGASSSPVPARTVVMPALLSSLHWLRRIHSNFSSGAVVRAQGKR